VEFRISVLRGGDSTKGDSARESEDLAKCLRQERDLDALVDLVPRRVEPTDKGSVKVDATNVDEDKIRHPGRTEATVPRISRRGALTCQQARSRSTLRHGSVSICGLSRKGMARCGLA
jgi:hypothetical protein